MFVDSHCHLEMEDFEKDRKEVIEKSLQDGLQYILTVGTDETYFEKVIQIIEQHPSVYGAVGIHPHNSKDYNPELGKTIEIVLKHKKIVGYGEIGLDFFKNYSPRESQIHAFQLQLEVAKRAKLPAIIHSRNAKDETIRILNKACDGNLGGIIHCYSYDLPTAKQFLDMGFAISIPGTITYKNSHALMDVVKFIPMDKLLAETDSPFLTPHPFRGKRNEPSFVKLTIEKIAQVKGKTIEETATHLTRNFERIFLHKGNG
ncbi:MAG: TatD family hydrolase [Syntrophorhabdus sp.]